MNMKNLIATLIATAALVGSQASAANAKKASDYITDKGIPEIGTSKDYDTFIVDVPLVLNYDVLALYDGAHVEFQAQNSAICTITGSFANVCFEDEVSGSHYDFVFEDPLAQQLISSQEECIIPLISTGQGLVFWDWKPILTLNEVEYGGQVELGGTMFTYKAPIASPGELQAGEIAFMGFADSSPQLSIVAKSAVSPVPEPATGTLSLLALAALAARRRKH